MSRSTLTHTRIAATASAVPGIGCANQQAEAPQQETGQPSSPASAEASWPGRTDWFYLGGPGGNNPGCH